MLVKLIRQSFLMFCFYGLVVIGLNMISRFGSGTELLQVLAARSVIVSHQSGPLGGVEF